MDGRESDEERGCRELGCIGTVYVGDLWPKYAGGKSRWPGKAKPGKFNRMWRFCGLQAWYTRVNYCIIQLIRKERMEET